MNWFWVAAAPLVWLLATLFVYLPLAVTGVILVPVMALLRRYEWGVGSQGRCLWWRDRWMRMWETVDNGCCPAWYDLRSPAWRPLWLNVVIWSAFRNAVGGNPLHLAVTQEEFDQRVRWVGDVHPSGDAIRHFLETGKRKWHWHIAQIGWRTGFWASYPWMREWKKDPLDQFDVVDVRHGWKFGLHTTYAGPDGRRWINFSPWDSGRRRN